jgi:ABC-type branched-subunit amino acid transport system substrate-binding protein
VRIGLLTVKTGPLAAGGIQMEQGTLRFLKDRNNMMAGRKVELVVADTGGNPAGTKTKTQELVERENVDMIFGPLAAFELLAITDYTAQAKVPVLSLAAAEDMTQRRPNPYFIRASATSSQNMHPLADYAAKELKFKTVITIADDFAFGHEQMAGFQRVFEDAGGRVVKKLWPPLTTPDYTPYLAQISGADAVVQGFAGSNPLKFMKQYKDQGLKLPVLGGGPACDDALLKSYGDEAVGMISCSAYQRPRSPEQQAADRRDGPRLRQHSGPLLRGPLHQRPGRGGRAGEDGRQDRRSGGGEPGAPRGVADRHPTRAVHLRPPRQRGGHLLHPALRAQGRQARQHHDQDVPEGEPVLDLRREVVPGPAGLLAVTIRPKA